MMTALTLMRWEWFKLRRRMMPWILLVIVVVFSQIFLWGNYTAYRNNNASGQSESGFSATDSTGRRIDVSITCDDIANGTVEDKLQGLDDDLRENFERTLVDFHRGCDQIIEETEMQRQHARASFTLPNSLSEGLGVAHGIGVILISILTAAVVGTEYGWGTLRTILVRGTGRRQLLAAKMSLMVVVALVALLIVAVGIAISSLIANSTVGGDAAPPSAEWSEAVVGFGKALYGLLPYVTLGTFAAILTSSGGSAIALTLGYYFGEQLLVAIMINVFDWFEPIADYILGRNVTAWIIGDDVDAGGVLIGGAFGDIPSTVHAFLVILGYIIVLSAISFWIFQRRDVAGASGT